MIVFWRHHGGVQLIKVLHQGEKYHAAIQHGSLIPVPGYKVFTEMPEGDLTKAFDLMKRATEGKNDG
jgi:hypothetical protein